jgi:hypothetical protein
VMPCNLCLRQLALLALSAVTLAPTLASAEQPRTHDGFYLRLAGGFAIAIDPAEAEWPGVNVEGTLGGTGVAWDIAAGGTPTPGLVLGGGIFGAHVPSPEADDMEATVVIVGDINGDVEFDGMTFALLAPFIDYYPSPREGLHLTAAVGLGLLSVGDGTWEGTTYEPFQDHGSAGVGALVGVGYEFWLADRWSLGALARVTYAAPAGDDDDQTDWQHHLWLPAGLLTVTWH